MLEQLELDIPSWVRNPDIQSVHWLNRCMIKMWPHVNVATQKWFRDDFWPNELSKNIPEGKGRSLSLSKHLSIQRVIFVAPLCRLSLLDAGEGVAVPIVRVPRCSSCIVISSLARH